MGKITKHAEFLDVLHTMLTKDATAGTATGKPGADTHYESVSKETEHVDKNKEGHPEHNPQEFKQEKAKDPSDPSKTHKAAEATPDVTKEANATVPANAPDTKVAAPGVDAPHVVEQKASPKVASEAPGNEKLAQLGQQLLDTINEMNKQATAGTATGKPGADTHYESVSKETEHVDKNKEGHPEHNPQEFKQEKAKDKSDPSKTHHKSAEELELDKEASFELGRQFARAFLSNKTAAIDTDIYKEAGRRDFEALIAQASAELEHEAVKPHKKMNIKMEEPEEKTAEATEVDEEALIKQAEEEGAQAFYTLLKQAQEEEKANQVKIAFEAKLTQLINEKELAEKQAKELSDKLAEKEATIEKKAEEEKRAQEFATWGSRIVDEVITRLKHEPST